MSGELCKAIKERLVVTCVYDGRPRRGEPHLVGRAGDEHTLMLELYQTGGSSSRRVPCWKRFAVSGISNLVITEERFTPRADFNPDPPQDPWRSIVCRV
jgi:hypothetical protein